MWNNYNKSLEMEIENQFALAEGARQWAGVMSGDTDSVPKEVREGMHDVLSTMGTVPGVMTLGVKAVTKTAAKTVSKGSGFLMV